MHNQQFCKKSRQHLVRIYGKYGKGEEKRANGTLTEGSEERPRANGAHQTARAMASSPSLSTAFMCPLAAALAMGYATQYLLLHTTAHLMHRKGPQVGSGKGSESEEAAPILAPMTSNTAKSKVVESTYLMRGMMHFCWTIEGRS